MTEPLEDGTGTAAARDYDTSSYGGGGSEHQAVREQSHTDGLQLDPTTSIGNVFHLREQQARERKEKELRKAAKERRAETEREIIGQLSERQQAIIAEALEIVRNTNSRWLVMVFKRIASVRSRELFMELREPERFFEPVRGGGDYWREAWRDPETRKRLDEHAGRKRLGVFITKLLRLYGV